jgi:outer membrane protein assembly factor BamB
MSRKFLFAGAWLVAGLAAAGAAELPNAGGQNTSAVAFQINPAHTGAIRFKHGFAPPLAKIWTADLSALGGGLAGYPLVADGGVFVTVYGKVVALDLSTGAQKWQHAMACCNPMGAYDAGRVFFADSAGTVTALSADSGDVQWSITLPDQYIFSTPPIAAEGRVFAGGAGSGGTLYALAEANGALEWSKPFGGDIGSPAYGNAGIYAGAACNLFKFSFKGVTKWSFAQSCVGGGGMAVHYKKRLFYGAAETPVVIDSHDGSIVGAYPSASPPALFKDGKAGLRGLTLNTFGSTALECWDAKTGEILWRFSGDNTLITMPIVVNDTVFIGSLSGKLYGLDGHTGTQIWSDDLGWQITGLTAGQGTLIATANTSVVAYRPQP